ncbi:MAG: polysaccharide biosynthesis protein [Lachnospiraceae bacterium]|nr:polysaccharide biosynthesis protein [Lachnospiraceae bacterium]
MICETTAYIIKKSNGSAMSTSIKRTLLQGTFILTIASILTKLLGFYNRIFLASTIGAREIGIYQLIFPVYLIVHCISCQGFEMGIMKFVSEEASFGNRRNVWRYLRLSFLFSFSLSLLCMAVVMLLHEPIAIYLLKQRDCSESLFIMAFAFPIISVKDCILSYFYAMKKTLLPASCQLLEQCVRVSVIWGLATFVLAITKDASLATIGLVAGEASSMLLSLLAIPHIKKEINGMQNTSSLPHVSHYTGSILPRRTILSRLLKYCLPITGNRLLLTTLSSVESVLVPFILAKTLGNEDQALELFGVLTGMSMTFVLFPSAITNSVAMMLLPTISEAKAQQQKMRICKAASLSLHYCLLLGILCTAIFLTFGKNLGTMVFQNQSAGEFLFILSWLCPFIYISTTFTSILNGLGKTTLTFSNNVIAVLIRIFSIVAFIPKMGIQGYLLGLLVSYGVLAFLSIFHVHSETNLYFNARRSILSPACLAFLGTTFALISEFFLLKAGFPHNLVTLCISIAILCGIYGFGTLLLRLLDY